MSSIQIQSIKSFSYSEIIELVRLSFQTNPQSNGKEHVLVKMLLNSNSLIADLAIGAFKEHKPIGFVLVNPITHHADAPLKLAALAPLVVHPDYQQHGIGSNLVHEGIKRAKNHEIDALVLVGNPSYYSKFGFEPIADYNQKLPYKAISLEQQQICWLKKNHRQSISGTLVYPLAFSEYLD